MRRLFILAMVLTGVTSIAHAQVELKDYANANGYIDVQELTCAQLAGTYQEDADFLGVWYSGWYNGLAKKHAINVPRTKAGIHNVIVYCKAKSGQEGHPSD
ncbi:HdeA/HdeB family chaperone [Bradyrhizobium sp. JR3.5]